MAPTRSEDRRRTDNAADRPRRARTPAKPRPSGQLGLEMLCLSYPRKRKNPVCEFRGHGIADIEACGCWLREGGAEGRRCSGRALCLGESAYLVQVDERFVINCAGKMGGLRMYYICMQQPASIRLRTSVERWTNISLSFFFMLLGGSAHMRSRTSRAYIAIALPPDSYYGPLLRNAQAWKSMISMHRPCTPLHHLDSQPQPALDIVHSTTLCVRACIKDCVWCVKMQ